MEQALPKREIPENASYQLQYRKCGKANCHTCQHGNGHGPYWYAYWKADKKVRSRYIGKEYPDAAQKEKMSVLSQREVEVMRGLAEGKTFGAIADALEISEHTVANHMWHARKRLGLAKNVQLIVYALKVGLIRLEDIELPGKGEEDA